MLLRSLMFQAVQEGNLELEDLSRFTQTCLATLTAAYKQQSLTQQVLRLFLVQVLLRCI